MPDRLFKYQAYNTQTLANLKNRTLWFSLPSQFNDPFDCATTVTAVAPSEADFDRAAEYFESKHGVSKKTLGAYGADGRLSEEYRRSLVSGAQAALDSEREAFYHKRGVACLTTKHDDMLMWSHYADGHRGFCLEFDGTSLPFSKALATRYRNATPSLNLVNVLGNQDADAMLEAMVLTKAECWSYEQEWRILHAEQSTPYTYPWENLTAIHLGAAMPYVHLEIIALILRDSPTRLCQMEKQDNAFSVVSKPITYVPFSYRTSDG